MSWSYTSKTLNNAPFPATSFRVETYQGRQRPRTRKPGAYGYYNAKITKLVKVNFGTVGLDTGLWQAKYHDLYLGGRAIPPSLPNNSYFQAAYAKAYGKFVDNCNLGAEKSQMATNLAERASTLEMVEKRMIQLLKGAKALKKGNFKQFCTIFGITPKKEHAKNRWSRPQQFSGLWLEYWFGWAPTVADINNGLNIVKSHFGGDETLRGPIIAKGASTFTFDTGFKRTYSDSSGSCLEQLKGKMQVRIQADVIVTDGFGLMWNQLGLVNLLSTSWELIPFSWFAGWFGNIAQVLGQSTDFVGLELQNITVSCKTSWTEYTHSAPSWDQWCQREIRYNSYVRTIPTTLPRVRLVWALPKKLSLTRGATLASLITVLFSPSGPSKAEALKRLSRG